MWVFALSAAIGPALMSVFLPHSVSWRLFFAGESLLGLLLLLVYGFVKVSGGSISGLRWMLRKTKTPLQTTGRYFNIADNEQPRGPWSAADLYRVFNDGTEKFYELETIAPLQVREGRGTTSTLLTRTTIYKGAVDTLEHLLPTRWSINLEPYP